MQSLNRFGPLVSKVFSCLAALLTMSGCAIESPTAIPVTQVGNMREVMRMGQSEARQSLASVVERDGAIAVGALEGLRGEITIMDGKVWVARPEASALRVSQDSKDTQDSATLLTFAHVSKWKSIPIRISATGSHVDDFIKAEATKLGLDTTSPIPFVIEGKTSDIAIHVINGYCPIANDPSTMDDQPWRWDSESSESDQHHVQIVGFYAPDAVGEMTHHGTSIHAHAILSAIQRDDVRSTHGKTITGHVDRVTVQPGMVLKLPIR